VSSTERVKRPKLKRRQPTRSWSTLFQVPEAAGDQPASESGATTAGRSPEASLNDVVARSVDLGYRVIDDYIRQGQQAARRIQDGSYGPGTFSSDVQQLSARFAQYASDFMGVWLELMQLATVGSQMRRGGATPNGPQEPPSEAVAQKPSGAGADGARREGADAREHDRVRIEIRSAHRTQVSLDLRPDASRGSLVVHALRAVDPAKPRIKEVVFTPGAADEPGRLSIQVPPDQPEGTYNGLIVDEQTSRPVGMLSVHISRE